MSGKSPPRHIHKPVSCKHKNENQYMAKQSKTKILAISGSTKSKSTSLSILKFLAERFKEEIEFNIFNKIGELPHFNPDLEEELPNSVLELRTQIYESDGILFCTPEYVFSLPGSLKNLIEWNVSTILFSAKPVAIIVAAASGKKAFESLDLILTTIESTLPNESKLLIQGAKGKIDYNGEITDEEVVSSLGKVITSLIETIKHKNRKPTKYK